MKKNKNKGQIKKKEKKVIYLENVQIPYFISLVFISMHLTAL